MGSTEDGLHITDKTIEKKIGSEMKEIKEMIRHLHAHIENITNRQNRTDDRICNLGHVLEHAFEKALDFDFDRKLADLVLNPDIDWNNENKHYTPIDKTDEIDWGKKLEKQKRRRNEYVEDSRGSF